MEVIDSREAAAKNTRFPMVLNFVREMRNRLAHLTRGICEAVRGISSHGGDMSVHSLEGEQGYFAVIVMCD